MARNTIITEQKLRKLEIARDERSTGGLIVDNGCIVRGAVSTGAVTGNKEMGYFWMAWNFGESDVIYPTYEEAKAALIEYFWLLKEIEEG